MMNEFGKFGTLHESNGRYTLRFERFYLINQKMFSVSLQILVTSPNGILSQQGRWISELVVRLTSMMVKALHILVPLRS